MIARSSLALLLVLPLAALAQPVHFDVTCLPREQQDEARAKAKVVMDEAAAQRRARAGVTGPETFTLAQKDRDAKLAAANECGMAAKREARVPGEVCAREFQEMREAAERVDKIFDLTINPERPIDKEERRQLEAVRAQYPACPSKRP